MAIADEFNDYPEWYEEERNLNKKIIRSFLKSIPKERLTDILKELKIIVQDWERKGTVFKERT